MSMDKKYRYCKPELWGGIECTINRVGDEFRDQLHATGHYTRKGDIEEFAALGIRKLRYPVLWEYHQPVKEHKIDWEWTKKQLNEIRSFQIEPIAGLLHHGSGPAYTDLLDEEFPEKLASYAELVATEFPWINYYTPVNEPLTTARFSGMYGLWYPHHTNELSFVKMLLNQVKGIILSMQRIRKINPLAKLVQTEDLSKTHSTPLLAYQALFENKRRWLTYDLLCGKINKQHFFWNYFISLGIAEAELLFFLENSCPPDIVGFNYYVTSERYLDENLENYPESVHGGNGRHRYADTEAVRVHKLSGPEALLKEAWTRYQLPMAITECHLNCTREEQLRWFKQTWDACCKLTKEGVEMKAVTAWCLLGAYDWNSLLTCSANHYESGIFDVRNNVRRPTALASLIRSLATTGTYEHPLLHQSGWWQKKEDETKTEDSPFLLISGQNGTLAQAFMRVCDRRSIPYLVQSANEPELSDQAAIEQLMDLYKPAGASDRFNQDDLANTIVDILIDSEDGTWRLPGEKGIELLNQFEWQEINSCLQPA